MPEIVITSPNADPLDINDVKTQLRISDSYQDSRISAAINPADWQFRYGYYRDVSPRTLPLILGWDVAGTVQDTGALAPRFKPGDQVFAMADMNRDGAYADA